MTVGKRIKNLKGSYKEETSMFISAAQLHKWLEIMFFDSDDLKIDVVDIREHNKHIFWNMIYYFNDYQLPFDFILPYEETKEFDLQYEELKRTAKAVKIYQVRDNIEEPIQEENEEEVTPSASGGGRISIGRFE